MKMEDLAIDEAWNSELGQWLNVESRCFGDKGDVEDITEGEHTCAKHLSCRSC